MRYTEDPRFSSFVLENSYVLGVHVGPSWAAIEIDACLSVDHPDADKKIEGEWAAFKPVQLWFKQATIDAQLSGTAPALSADDSWDYGEIDRFEVDDSGEFLIEGEFGRLSGNAREIYVKEFSNG